MANTCSLISKPSWISCEQKYSQAQSITFTFIGQAWASLGEPHTSLTVHTYMCACLFGPTTYCKWADSNILMSTLTVRTTARLQCRGEREQDNDSSWMCWQHTWQLNFWKLHAMSLTIAWQVRVRMTDKKYTVARFALGKHLAWLLIHSRDPLLVHSLSAKLCPCV